MSILDLLINFFFSFLATVGFSIFFNSPKKSLLPAGIIGAKKQPNTRKGRAYAGRTETTGLCGKHGIAPPGTGDLHLGQCLGHRPQGRAGGHQAVGRGV